jgi:hypothetical protein
MAKAAMLFNGIRYSFEVVDQAFNWAKLNKGILTAIFLRAKRDPGEGYIFPSDLDAAENLYTTDDSNAGHIAIFDSNIRLLAHAAAIENIKVYPVILTDPKREQLLHELEGSECIFTSDDIHEPGTLTIDSINIKKFLTSPPVPVKIIKSRP